MSRGIFSSRYRAWLYNMVRDVDEMVFYVAEVVEPRRVEIRTDVVVSSSGEVRLLVDADSPQYLNVAEALLLIRRLMMLVLQMDEREKMRELEKHWNEKIGEVDKEE
jgi:hypothetical protein